MRKHTNGAERYRFGLMTFGRRVGHTAVLIPGYINFTEESDSEDYFEKAIGFIKAAQYV
jgi:hypothetical protein